VQLPYSPALAFLYLWPPSPLATIHGSFASLGTRQCRKNGINVKLNCPRPVGALRGFPGAARWHTASAQHSGAQELRSQQCSQGSSWVSGLIVRCPPARSPAVLSSTVSRLRAKSAVRAPRRCPPAPCVP